MIENEENERRRLKALNLDNATSGAVGNLQAACVQIATAKSLAGPGEQGRRLALAQTKVEEALLWLAGTFPGPVRP